MQIFLWNRLLLRFQAKAVCEVHIPECTSNGRIKICSDKILSWDCHPGTDARIITQNLRYVSGMEDMDYWSYNSYTVTWRWECCMRERRVNAWKTHQSSFCQSQIDVRNWELLTENRFCNSSWGFVWATMLSIKPWAEIKAITVSTGRNAKLWWHI